MSNRATDRSDPIRMWSYLERLAFFRASANEWHAESSDLSRIFFALDTNVLESMFEDDDNKFFIFHDDNAIEREFVRLSFFEFLFCTLSKDRPVIILPGHDRESASFFDKIADRQSKLATEYETTLADIETLKSEIAASGGEVLTNEAFEELSNRVILRRLRLKLYNLVITQVSQGRITSLGGDHTDFDDTRKYMEGISELPRSDVEFLQERRNKNSLDEEILSRIWLKFGGDNNIRLKTYKNDCLALARAITINSAGWDYGEKCFLITFDDFLRRSWNSIANDSSTIPDIELSGKSMVKKPTQFFEQIPFFTSTWSTEDRPSTRHSLSTLSNSLLGTSFTDSIGSVQSGGLLEDSIEKDTAFVEAFRKVSKLMPEMHASIRSVFSMLYLRQLESGLGETKDELPNVGKHSDIGKLSSGVQASLLDKLAANLKEQGDVDFDTFMFTAIKFGVLFAKVMDANTNTYRYIPPIFFDRFPVATEVAAKIILNPSTVVKPDRVRMASLSDLLNDIKRLSYD